MPRVLLLVVDGCTSRVLQPALEAGELPALAGLAERGTLRLDCLSIFPSITPAATASIVTGRYPAHHGIAGMSWWNPDTGEVSYFGEDVGTILRRGLSDYLREFLVRLNGDRLRAPTLFELVERHGRRAACFNHLIFRGDVAHETSPPWLLRLLTDVGGITLHGPSWLCLGNLVSSTGTEEHVDAPGGLFNRYGIDDRGTESFLRDLPAADHLPDFTVAYFPDFDFDSHAHGPRGALETLRRLDTRLHHVFEHWGGLDRVLADTRVVLTADHSHSEIGSGQEAAIALDEVLAGFQCATPSNGWQDGDQLLICPNMRAAELYVRAGHASLTADVVRALLAEPRIDQAIWREPRDVETLHVATADRGRLSFRVARVDEQGASDDFGGRWVIDGDLTAVDVSVSGGRLRYGQYPNALERIANGIDHPRAGRLWATARPGCEFRAPGQSIHPRGGSHGTLHELDSLVPLLMAGQPPLPALRHPPRIVDVAPLCAAHLGIPFEATSPAPAPG